MQIKKITDPSFKEYGKVITGIDVSALMSEMEKTPAPDEVIYVPSDERLEKLEVFDEFRDVCFGGMPVQLGYCNGLNHTLNALEYHRDSEVNLACTDLIFLLGREQDVDFDNFTYDTSKVEAFLIPKGTLVEVYATTLHYAPISYNDGHFRCVVVLPRGTNFPLERKNKGVGEDKLLTHVNKWLLAHPDAGIEGAHAGLVGENLTV
ncbi:MAG: DUF4867 family protein [Clostridia bacterium]|nr:DUF4867 family protein [Clostridia bacterium]